MKTYYYITISYAQETEYFNSNLVNDDYSTKSFEQREGFENYEDAEYALNNILKPYAEKHNWDVSFSIDTDEQ